MDHASEKQPSNSLNIKFIAGSQVVSKILPKLMAQHVILTFISPPLYIHQTIRYICHISVIGSLLMGYPCFTSSIRRFALPIYSNHRMIATPEISLTWPSFYAKSHDAGYKVAQRVQQIPSKTQWAEQRPDSTQNHTNHTKYNSSRFNHLKASFT